MKNAFLLLTMIGLLGVTPSQVVSVAYAGSLVKTMEGPIAAAFEKQAGVTFEGEGKGSKALANLLKDGSLDADVFLSADASLYPGLAPFGRAALVVAYAPSSRYATQLDAAVTADELPTYETDRGFLQLDDHTELAEVLRTPGFRLGRTDPQLDPKGGKTLAALQVLGVAPDPEQVFPEEDLLVRVQSGEADAGFFYTTETNVPGLKTIALPDGIGTRPGIGVTYAIEALPNAPHADAAKTFVDFILHGAGKPILEAAGVQYL